MALCCLPSMSMLAITMALDWIYILAQARSEPCSCSGKSAAEVGARLQFATQNMRGFICTRKGCDNTPVALCCLQSMSLLARRDLEWVQIWFRPEMSPSATVSRQVADEVEARLQFATQSSRRLIWVWKGCGNTLVGLCCLPSMSLLARSALGWAHILAQARSEPCSYCFKSGNG